jgi:multidrug transporter EmrE-like cation transporter
MNVASVSLLLTSIVLSTLAQLLLKFGMSQISEKGSSNHLLGSVAGSLTSPWVLGGLAVYFASAVVWLGVLSRVDVSRAYPCVALGFALTVIAAHFFLGEPISTWKLVGVAVIFSGVVIVGFS